MENLSSNVNKLNVNANVFVPNVNAVEFVPSFLQKPQQPAATATAPAPQAPAEPEVNGQNVEKTEGNLNYNDVVMIWIKIKWHPLNL